VKVAKLLRRGARCASDQGHAVAPQMVGLRWLAIARAALLISAALPACNLVFTSASDAASGVHDATAGVHDEDQDGVRDDADTCPFLDNVAQVDVDQDGVGDRCDTLIPIPVGSIERNKLAVFLPLTNTAGTQFPAPFQTGDVQWARNADDFSVAPNLSSALEIAVPMATASVWLNFVITHVPQGANAIRLHAIRIEGAQRTEFIARIVSSPVAPPSPGLFFELDRFPVQSASPLQSAAMPAGLQVNDRGSLRLNLSGATNQISARLELITAMGLVEYDLLGSQANYVGVSKMQIVVEGFGLRVTSVAVIEKL
jgi:hypothetical protein